MLAEIHSRLPDKFDRYFEPFAGGGALFFSLAPRLSDATLLDRNIELILAYQAIKRHRVPCWRASKSTPHGTARNIIIGYENSDRLHR